MAIVNFKSPRFTGYSYDTSKGVVLSTKRSASPKPLAWAVKAGRKYVKLYTTSGLAETCSKHKIEQHFLDAQPQAKTRPMKAAVNTTQPASLVPFKYAGLHEYKYDTASRTVLSSKRAATPRPLTWVRKGNELYVKLYDTISRTINLSRTDIENHWINTDIDFCNQIQLEAVDAPSTGMCDQTAIEESDYVLYSVQNKCCRYFESNTQLEEAIRQLRNDCATAVEPEDIRVLIPRTGESKRIVEVKTCTTYKLA